MDITDEQIEIILPYKKSVLIDVILFVSRYIRKAKHVLACRRDAEYTVC